MDRHPNETARKIADDALILLAVELADGRDGALKNVLAAMARFREYSWRNVLLIAAQRPDATRVGGFHTWDEFGRTVKDGEKGILTFTPPHAADGTRATYIFDVSQTTGKPLPEKDSAPTKADIWNYGERLKAMVAQRGIELQIDRSIEPAWGVSSGGKIRLRPGLSPDQFLSTLIHELAHEMLHHRPGVAPQTREAFYAIEAQASGVAYVVARGLGLETRTDAAEHLAQFCRDPKSVSQTLAVIQTTSSGILAELLPHERTTAARSALDSAAFANTHRKYRDRLVQSMIGLVRDRDRAEDIAARAFEVGWEKRSGFQGNASPRTWIEAIARNEVRSFQRHDKIRQFETMDGPDARDFASPEVVTADLEREEDLARLQKALDQIPKKLRRALVKHFVEGISVRDIAQREHVPEGTVRTRIHRGKQLLREAWESPLKARDPKELGSKAPVDKPQEGGETQTTTRDPNQYLSGPSLEPTWRR